MAVFAGYLACSQTLYFLFKVRRERVIKFIDRQRKGVVARAGFVRRCFRKKRKEKLKKLLCTGYRLLFLRMLSSRKYPYPSSDPYGTQRKLDNVLTYQIDFFSLYRRNNQHSHKSIVQGLLNLTVENYGNSRGWGSKTKVPAPWGWVHGYFFGPTHYAKKETLSQMSSL